MLAIFAFFMGGALLSEYLATFGLIWGFVPAILIILSTAGWMAWKDHKKKSSVDDASE